MASSDPKILVTDQRGQEWEGVPGYTNAALRSSNSTPYKKRPSIVPVLGKKPPVHGNYESNCHKFNFFEASYQGGSDYKDATDASGKPVFVPHPNESPEMSGMRKRLAVVRNYAYSISAKFGNFIFSKSIIRSTDTNFSDWSQDVDGNGTTLAQFMEQASECARYLGIWGVVFDTTKESRAQTQATARALGNRPVLSGLHPNRILNWTEDRQQLLIRHDVGDFGEVWLWTRSTVQKFGLDAKGKVNRVDDPILHGYSRMPIVLVSGLNDYKSLIRDIAELQKRLFHLDAVLIEEVVRQTFTSYLLVGVTEKELDSGGPVSISGRKFTCIGKAPNEVRADKIGSDVSQADSIRSSIDMDEREIFRTIGLRLPDVVESHPESGRALRIRQGETVAMAERIAANTEAAEKTIVDLYNFATGSAIEYPQYPDEFNEDDLQVLLQDTLLVLSANFGRQLKAQQQIKYIRQAFSEDPILRSQLEAEALANPALNAPIAPPTMPGVGTPPTADQPPKGAEPSTPE